MLEFDFVISVKQVILMDAAVVFNGLPSSECECASHNITIHLGERSKGGGEGLPGQASCSPASFGDAVGGGQDAVGLGMEVLS